MKHHSDTRWLPHTVEQMFDLAVDIERYPEFLPHWPRATITGRGENVLQVSQEIDLGIRRLRFDSRALLDRPGHLQIRSTSPPFRNLRIDWRFRPGDNGGCLTTLMVEIEMRSLLLETLAGTLMQRLTGDVFTRFRDRAALLYPEGCGQEPPAAPAGQ